MLKKQRLKAIFAQLAVLAIATPGLAHAQDEVVLANYGGSWAEALDEVCVASFEEEHGINVRQVATDNSLAQIKAQQLTGNVLWDISPSEADTGPVAVENGWFQELDWSYLDPEEKFPPIARKPYRLGASSYSVVLAHRTDKLEEGKIVTSWADFWNVEEFPGPRSLRDTPVENLEYALLADGVDKNDVYEVLATQEGVDRAFEKLEEIKPHITVWWKTGQQPVQLLASGEVHYATSFNGRITQIEREGVPVRIAWPTGSLNVSYYSIQKGAPNPEGALKFMKHCWTDPNRLAELAEMLSYPGFAPELYDLLPEGLGETLPTYPENLQAQLEFSPEFWAEHRSGIQERWDGWRIAN